MLNFLAELSSVMRNARILHTSIDSGDVSGGLCQAKRIASKAY